MSNWDKIVATLVGGGAVVGVPLPEALGACEVGGLLGLVGVVVGVLAPVFRSEGTCPAGRESAKGVTDTRAVTDQVAVRDQHPLQQREGIRAGALHVERFDVEERPADRQGQ